MKVPGPGIYRDVPAAEYHSWDAVSSTFLKAFRHNPASALVPFEPTEDMLVGSAIHSWVLEGEEAFRREYAVLFESDLNKNTNEYKGLKRAFLAENEGKVILPALHRGTRLWDVLVGVKASLDAHPMASAILKEGSQELSLVWDDECGARCKARIDHEPGQKVLVDLKKTSDVTRFAHQIVDLGYWVQSGTYCRGARANGMEVDTFVFIAVESEPPFAVSVGYLSPDFLAAGVAEAGRLIGLVHECRQANSFPPYRIPPHIHSLSQLTPRDLLEEWEIPSWIR